MTVARKGSPDSKQEHPVSRQPPPEYPTRVEDNSRMGEHFIHPAYGNVVVTKRICGGGVRLCGSDLLHNSVVALHFTVADHYRNLSNDHWIGSREVLLEVSMSEAQWARFVSSHSDGRGTPVTINYRQRGPLEAAPDIAVPQATKREVHGEEMAASLREHLQGMRDEVKRLGDAIAGGRVGVRDLRELHRELVRHVDQLPGSVQFVYDMFAEATERVAEDAKIEVEAHVDNMARGLGLEELRRAVPQLAGGAAAQHPDHEAKE